MDRSPPAMRLHRIHSKMPFGHTKYVPEEETRNLRANFPEADILQPFKEMYTAPRLESFEVTDKIVEQDVAADYCKQLTANQLSHPNYRKLSWTSMDGDYEESLDTTRRMRTPKTTAYSSFYASARLPTLPSELDGPRLEARYRLEHSIPFCLNPNAAYLIHHASITGQRKKVEEELGTCVFLLNDRSHFHDLEVQLQERFDRRSDTAHRFRWLEELKKSKRHSLPRVATKTDEIRDPCMEELTRLQIKKKSSSKRKLFDGPPVPLNSSEASVSVASVDKGETSEQSTARPPTDNLPDTKSTARARLRQSTLSQTDSMRSKGEPSDAVLTSRVSMRTLYDQAEESVKSKAELVKRTMKYATLSWQR